MIDDFRWAEIQGEEMSHVARLRIDRLKSQGFDVDLWQRAAREYYRFFDNISGNDFIKGHDLLELFEAAGFLQNP